MIWGVDWSTMGNKISFDASRSSRYYTPKSLQVEEEKKPVNKPAVIYTLCKLPATKLHSSTQNFQGQVRAKSATKSCSSQDTWCLLQQVSIKLETIERKRYIMQQKARIEWCKRGMKLTELDTIEWYHYSNCPKSIIVILQCLH